MLIRTLTGAALVCCAATALPAAADTEIKLKTDAADEPDTLYVTGGKVRMESAGEAGKRGRTVALYDSNREVFTGLHAVQEIYVEMDEEAVRAQGERAAKAREKAREQLQAQLKEAPPERRAIIKRRMEEMGLSEPDAQSGSEQPQVENKPTERTDTVNGVECTEYEAYRGGDKTGTACIATREQLGMPKGDYQTLAGMYDFLHRIAEISAAGPGAADMENFFADVEGIPVRLVSADGNRMELTEINTESLPKDLFQVPEGYTEMTLSELEAARRQQRRQQLQKQRQQQQQPGQQQPRPPEQQPQQ